MRCSGRRNVGVHLPLRRGQAQNLPLLCKGFFRDTYLLEQSLEMVTRRLSSWGVD